MALQLGSGCSSVGLAVGGFKEMRGARGEIAQIREAPSSFYSSLSRIEVGQVTNSTGPICPEEMMQQVEEALRMQASETSAELNGSGASCTTDVEITGYKRPRGALALAGKEAMLMGRAKIRDSSDAVVADLQVMVFSRAMRTNQEELAGKFAKTLMDHLASGEGQPASGEDQPASQPSEQTDPPRNTRR